MEELPNFENRESVIDGLIDTLAEKEGMRPEDIISDIITFAELSEKDRDVIGYFEVVAEKIGIPYDELMAYAINKAKE
ncbi:MAG: hypothetical protein Q7S11_03195 [bacterium]|nr:hypothetical protein [bacterium]